MCSKQMKKFKRDKLNLEDTDVDPFDWKFCINVENQETVFVIKHF